MDVVEIRVERGSSVSPLDLTVPAGGPVDVAFVDAADPTATIDGDGWEIGALTVLLAAGAQTVSGVDERRVARVRAVLAALDAAR